MIFLLKRMRKRLYCNDSLYRSTLSISNSNQSYDDFVYLVVVLLHKSTSNPRIANRSIASPFIFLAKLVRTAQNLKFVPLKNLKPETKIFMLLFCNGFTGSNKLLTIYLSLDKI